MILRLVDVAAGLSCAILDEAFRARDDHGADGIGALDVAVVVDLDWERGAGEA